MSDLNSFIFKRTEKGHKKSNLNFYLKHIYN